MGCAFALFFIWTNSALREPLEMSKNEHSRVFATWCGFDIRNPSLSLSTGISLALYYPDFLFTLCHILSSGVLPVTDDT